MLQTQQGYENAFTCLTEQTAGERNSTFLAQMEENIN